jgi:sugar lactone lactonase YvrE
MKMLLSISVLFLMLARSRGYAGIQPGDVVYVDAVDSTIMRFDPISGVLEKVADFDVFGSGGGIALDNGGNIYGAINVGGFGPYSRFVRLDAATGQLIDISSERLITTTGRLTVTPAGTSLLVAGQSTTEGWALFRVDLADGHQSVLTKDMASTFMGVVPAIEHPWSVAYGPNGEIFMADQAYGHIVRFNSDCTGRQLIVELPYPWIINELVVDNSGTVYVTVLNLNPNGIVRVHPTDGTYEVLTQGGEFSVPVGLALAPDGNLFVGDARSHKLVRVDVNTGNQEVLSAVSSPRSMWVFNPTGQTTAPVLSIQPSVDGIAISWSDATDRWQLQTQLAPNFLATWTDVLSAPAVDGANRRVSFATTNSQQFFRLRSR